MIHVIEAGAFTTVQDLGRAGYQGYGIPVSGAMDDAALRIANLMVGNPEGAAALEITLAGPTLRFDEPRLLAVAGGDLRLRVGDLEIEPWRAFIVPNGSTLAFGHSRSGCRAYLAIAGGITVPEVLGSRSTYTRAEIGGVSGRQLRPDDVLPLGAPGPLAERIARSVRQGRTGVRVAAFAPSASLRNRYSSEPMIRLIPGTHQPNLTTESITRLHSTVFRVSPQSDRMGYRLLGPRIELTRPLELLTEGVAFGTVQLPPDGQPLLLMADRQTTGGYPRIGEVATVDRSLVAQLKPGDALRFRSCSLRAAQSLLADRERDIRRLAGAMSLLDL